MNLSSFWKFDFLRIFNRVITVVFSIILIIITLGIIIGVVSLFMDLRNLIIEKELTKQYLKIISDVLTLFILIELSRSLVDYFDARRLRIAYIIDAGIVFVLREIMIKMFEQKIEPQEIYAMSVLMLVLGSLRIASSIVDQRDRRDAQRPPEQKV